MFLRIYSHLCYACSLILLSALRNAETRELFQHGELSTNFYNQKTTLNDQQLPRRKKSSPHSGKSFQSAEIVEDVARYAAYQSDGLTAGQKAELTQIVKQAIGRFTFCPDECVWEETSALMDLFRD